MSWNGRTVLAVIPARGGSKGIPRKNLRSVGGLSLIGWAARTAAALPWLRRRVIPIPSQIIATEPIALDTMNRLMPRRRVYGDTRNLYNYYRPSPDDTCIVFGGRRGANTDDPLKKCAHLYSNLIEIFPELEGIRLTHSWWGYTGYSFDFLPHLTIRDGVHYATAFCGSGVVGAPGLGRNSTSSCLKITTGRPSVNGYWLPP